MKKAFLFLCIIPLLLLTACKKIDFSAFLTFVVYEFEYETLELTGAAIYSFTNPKLKPNQDIPLEINHTPATPQLAGEIGIYYTPENTKIFEATLLFEGIGEISQPIFSPVSTLSNSQRPAGFITGLKLIPILSSPLVDYRSFWEVIKDYEITRSITNDQMKGYIYQYKANLRDQSTWKWILMLAH